MNTPTAPQGRITRGTTGTNRLRRVDRWIAGHRAFRGADHPLVVDLGYGRNGITTLELHQRLARVRPEVQVIGLEIDPDRMRRAQDQLAQTRAGRTSFDPDARVQFAHGGFEISTPERPAMIRAMNVLRQYHESEVAAAWAQMTRRLAPGGILIDGTCNETGRVASWITVDEHAAPVTLTLSLRLAELTSPAIAAERLPKALIHRNVPGEPVHALFEALEQAWLRAAPLAVFSPVQRWRAALADLAATGWPALERHRHRLGELTVPYTAVAPSAPPSSTGTRSQTR